MPKKNTIRELTSKDCTVIIDIDKYLKAKDKGEISDSVKGRFIGQENAIKAIEAGVHIRSNGYNIFVCGMPGTGRMTAVQKMISQIIDEYPLPNDLCYIHNFDNPDEPLLIELPRGMGIKLKTKMENFLRGIFATLPKIIEDEGFIAAKNRILYKYTNESKAKIKKLGDKLQKDGLALVEIQYRDTTVPDIYVNNGEKMIPWDEFTMLAEKGEIKDKDVSAIEKKLENYRSELESIFNQNRKLSKDMSKDIDELVKERIKEDIKQDTASIKKEFPYERIEKFISDVEVSILDNYNRFFTKEGDEVSDVARALDPSRSRNFFNRYTVNVILDSSNIKKAPVIIERQPNYVNLFGSIERTADRYGVWTTDFSKIKAGSILKSNGGFLVMNAYDVLTEYNVWKNLTRVLKTSILEMQHPDVQYGFFPNSLKPEPIPINTKVILIGDEYLFDILYGWDEYFRKIFKIKASFDMELDLTEDNLSKYVLLIKKMNEEENLLPLDSGAIHRLLLFSIRQAGYHDKLSARCGLILDLMREADYWARKANKKKISAEHIISAEKERDERHNLVERKIQELIEKDIIIIDTESEVVGQVNGLAVYDLGYYSFGRPSRITCTTSVGDHGIINIEKEAELSGHTHNKGVLILNGFMRERFGQKYAPSLTASICFEQSYSGVDGDSASSTEFYALLSSISGKPIKQYIAVTGSINQKGEIQAIGGVIEKVEGFFYTCKAFGLNGKQGVIIPKSNEEELILTDEVLEAIDNGLFHIYPVSHVDEGIEILTGIPAGEIKKDGTYPVGTINYLVEHKLFELYQLSKDKDNDEPTEKDKKKKTSKTKNRKK